MARADLVLTAEAPGVQSSQVAGVPTETFDSLTPGLYSTLPTAVGFFNSASEAVVQATGFAALFGGAGGSGNYFAVGSESHSTQATLDLATPQAYLGMWLSAVDPFTNLRFYSGGNLVASYNAAATLADLGPAYFGNPNNGGDTAEKFVYLNFIGTRGTTFDQVVFEDTNPCCGLEADNLSIRTTPLATPYPGTPVGGILPEPAGLGVVAVTIGAGLLSRRRDPRPGWRVC